jgi:hypothetical protein
MGEWENRELCPDGACIGVIGKSGTCTVCGKKGSGKTATDSAADADTEAETDTEAAADPATATAATAAAGSDPAPGGSEWDQRKLCPDGACVGVIGAKGRCSVCGRAGT